MVYTFKKNGVRAAVLTRAAAVQYLDSLTYDMLEQVTPPLSEELPMGMRYFFAKYDSGDLKKSYNIIKELYTNDADPAYGRDSISEKLTGALIHPETLGEEAYAAQLAEYAAGRDENSAFALYLCAADREKIPGFIEKAHEVLGNELQVILRYPLQTAGTFDGVFAYQTECGRIEDFSGADLPENSAAVVTFGADTDLAGQVTRLLDTGYHVCAVPEKGMDEETVCRMYDALSRPLTRRFRGQDSISFEPFKLSDSCVGRWMIDGMPVKTDAERMPGGFWQYGRQKHLAGYADSPAVLRCLAECALVLAAK